MVVKRQLNNTSCQHQYGRKYGHTLHTFLAHILRDTPKPKILIEIHVGGGGWVKFKVNLQSRTNIFTHSEENTFICKLYKYSSTPAICFNEPMFVQEKSDYCKKCNLSFIPSLHFTSHMLVHSGGKPSQVPRPTLHS